MRIKKIIGAAESLDEMDSYSFLTGLESQIDSLIMTYKQLGQQFPHWERVADSLVSVAFTQKGHIEALKDSLDKESAEAEQTGEEMARKILNDPASSFAPVNQDDVILSLIVSDEPVQND